MYKPKQNFLSAIFNSPWLSWGIAILLFSLMPSAYAANQLQQIDFKLDSQRQARILVDFSSPAVILDVKTVREGLRIELPASGVSDDQLGLLDVTEFASQVSGIEVRRRGKGSVLLLRIAGQFDYDYQLQQSRLSVRVKQPPAVSEPSQSLPAGRKTPMSINFQDIPVRSVLQLIADYNDFNLVVSDSVSGNLTLRLDGVPWQQVLDIILQVKGLDKRVDGNVVLIAPVTELDQRQQQQLENARLQEQYGKLESQLIEVKYAKAADIAAMIGGSSEVSMLSPRGGISVDERTNTLLVRELAPNLTVIRHLVESLDVPVKQVQIEARIVAINEGELDELGVRWGLTASKGDVTVGGSIESNLAAAGIYQGESGQELPLDKFLNVNLPTTASNASSIAFQVAKLGSDVLLDLELSALQRESKAEIMSSPRLITTNKTPAYIEQGTDIPYLEASSSGATSVSFKKAVLSLVVTPQITPDNRLVLDLNVTQDRPGEVVKAGEGEAVAINTQRIGTQVLVDDGETVVLGGIYQRSVTNSVDKVPLLGDIPYLGHLFKRRFQQTGRSELLIFVTPSVVFD
ncbi:type IV pilus secretin PilQ [Vibrio sp.]|uniref:type IV pilus secretin PilQ n=1 Tax=Vibrio sp. TaxID=678 RepID=UPI003D0E9734